MPEYGGIFDYQLSTTVFQYLTFGFMAAYALFLACMLPIMSYLTIRGIPLPFQRTVLRFSGSVAGSPSCADAPPTS
jgi:hypothetical protein